MTRYLSIPRTFLLSLVLAAFAAAPASAQYIYGVTSLQLDSGLNRAFGYSATALDYEACYYYDAAVGSGLYQDGVRIDADYYHGICVAEAFTGGAMQDERYYMALGDHYVIAYYYYNYYGYYDPYGFGYFGPGSYGGGFDYYGDYGPYYLGSSTYYLGSTQVTRLNQCTRVPTLNGPSSVTRGNNANFTLGNLCPTAAVSNWRFEYNTVSESGTVNRTTSTSASSWSGRIVTTGTVRVRVVQGGNTYNLSKAITVNPRTSFAFPAVTPTKVANGFNCHEQGTLTLPVPPTNGGLLGKTCLLMRASWNDGIVEDNGPNHQFKYVASVSPTFPPNAHPTTAIYYVIHPDLENSASDFFRAQCGDYNQSTNPTGFISGSQLLANARGHEVGSVRGHYQQYVTTQNRPENNVGLGMEQIVSGPLTSVEVFDQAVDAERIRRMNIISSAFSFEACNIDFKLDEHCNFSGNINFPPYQPCPPTRPISMSGTASSPTQIDLSWTDDSGDEQGFRLERSDAGGAFVQIASLGAGVTSYTDTAVAPNMMYIYRVIAWNANGPSAPTEVIVTTPPAGYPPAAPGSVWTESLYGYGTVTIGWSDLSDNEDGFVVERSDGWGLEFYPLLWAPANTTMVTDYNAPQGAHTYYYRVVAENAYGRSYSGEVPYPWW